VAEAGPLTAAVAVPRALGSPFSGLLSDRLGRRPMIVLALGSRGDGGFAIAALCQGLLAAGLALPLRPSRAG
jgi:MFS family permease